MGFKVLKEDEHALVFNKGGSGKVVDGPTRVSFEPATLLAAPDLTTVLFVLCALVLLEA